jgi:hypothetical protein
MDIRKFTTFVDDLADFVQNPAVLNTARAKCLAKYLTELGANSFLVEPEYTDSNYLVDYANYYARCHENYGRTTSRVHFFRLPVSELGSHFNSILEGEKQPSALQENYLGVIGRTCLVTYPKNDEERKRLRCYPILRTYTAHVFGAKLFVESIAFQEQDTEVAACSTTAIWFSLHALSKRFTTQEISSPYEITSSSSATFIRRNLGEVTRRFPTNGLALEQIEAYFRSHGLECIVNGMRHENMLEQLREAVGTYVRAGLPMVLVGHLFTSMDGREGAYVSQGFHAVTTLGFAWRPQFIPGAWDQRLERLFAHDDNVGPFSSFSLEQCQAGEFLKPSAKEQSIAEKLSNAIKSTENATTGIDTSRFTGYLMNESGTKDSGFTFRKLVPYYYLIPIDPKVRLPHETVHLFGQQIAQKIWPDFASRNYPPGPVPHLSTSVQLLDPAAFQQYLVQATTIVSDIKKQVLEYPGPKHLWMLSFTMESSDALGTPVADVLFDATALKQAGGLLTVIPHSTPEANSFFAVMVSTMRGQGPTLVETASVDLRPVFQEFHSQILASIGE